MASSRHTDRNRHRAGMAGPMRCPDPVGSIQPRCCCWMRMDTRQAQMGPAGTLTRCVCSCRDNVLRQRDKGRKSCWCARELIIIGVRFGGHRAWRFGNTADLRLEFISTLSYIEKDALTQLHSLACMRSHTHTHTHTLTHTLTLTSHTKRKRFSKCSMQHPSGRSTPL